jgi:hypothetical protein
MRMYAYVCGTSLAEYLNAVERFFVSHGHGHGHGVLILATHPKGK